MFPGTFTTSGSTLFGTGGSYMVTSAGVGTMANITIGNVTSNGAGANSFNGPLNVNGDVYDNAASQGYLALTGDLPGYAVNTYPTLKTPGADMYFAVAGVYAAYMNYTGNVYAVSDWELENEHKNMITGALDKVSQINGVIYNFKR